MLTPAGAAEHGRAGRGGDTRRGHSRTGVFGAGTGTIATRPQLPQGTSPGASRAHPGGFCARTLQHQHPQNLFLLPSGHG